MKNSGGRGLEPSAALFLKEFIGASSWDISTSQDGVHGIGNCSRREGGHRGGGARQHRFSRVAFLTLLGAQALSLGCSDDKTAAAQPQPLAPNISFAAIESPSMQFLPRQEEVSGWRLVEDPLVYPANRLAGYIDQEARHFRTTKSSI